ncbi:hypothetical protein AAFF_G00183800 [Aldrovandia affinis]|uniref:Uncharacterized protein n=1 Tax=Aldrovandia affinis TaxID=143900 RepID=A0AAD7RK85_9TELE|nr:hypothetical protein AAFF_G00183800 [Aldrovandia affinis]
MVLKAFDWGCDPAGMRTTPISAVRRRPTTKVALTVEEMVQSDENVSLGGPPERTRDGRVSWHQSCDQRPPGAATFRPDPVWSPLLFLSWRGRETPEEEVEEGVWPDASVVGRTMGAACRPGGFRDTLRYAVASSSRGLRFQDNASLKHRWRNEGK